MPGSRAGLAVSDNAVRTLLRGLVDYAGLFPPAALPMHDAVRNFSDYRRGDAAFMLGRFVCAASRLPELSEQLDALPGDSARTDETRGAGEAHAANAVWQVSAIGSGAGHELERDLELIAAFNARHAGTWPAHPSVVVDSLEVRVGSPDDVASVATQVGNTLLVFAELPAVEAKVLMPHVARAGLAAKVRAGGVTTDAFPAAEGLVTFLRAAVSNGVAAKATAGLHHPLRGEYRLTYAPGAACGTMFGFLNVFLAAALASAQGSDAQLLALLRESDPTSFRFHSDGIAWRYAESELTFDAAMLARTRSDVLLSFGSCSFTEPVSELHDMGVPGVPARASSLTASTP